MRYVNKKKKMEGYEQREIGRKKLINDMTDRINQVPKLTASAVEHNIDTISIQERRFYHSEFEISKVGDRSRG